MTQEILIRPYRSEDRPGVRQIAWETGFMGEPSDIFFDDREILCDILTLYFTDYEPQSSFVAESAGRVIGYLTGSRDVRMLANIHETKILPRIILTSLMRGKMWKKKSRSMVGRCMVSFFKGEFKTPDFSSRYPATLHINVDKDFRRDGVGERLMAAYLQYLSREKVPGVHLATMSEKGLAFFKKQGFEVLYESRRSYFRHILGQDIVVSIFGKKVVFA
jgi:GNAT superfamily N-acetyltransferase